VALVLVAVYLEFQYAGHDLTGWLQAGLVVVAGYLLLKK